MNKYVSARAKNSLLIFTCIERNAAYVFSGTLRAHEVVVLVSLHCPPENFMNNFRVHQCAPKEAKSAGIAEKNTALGLLCFALLSGDRYLGKATVLRTVLSLEKIQAIDQKCQQKPKINLIISVKMGMRILYHRVERVYRARWRANSIISSKTLYCQINSKALING